MTDGYRPPKKRGLKKIQLHRGLDGRIKSSPKPENDEADIGDVWAQQERIRQDQAFEDDQRRKDRQELRQQQGLVGVAKNDIGHLSTKVKAGLFGEESKHESQNSEVRHEPTEVDMHSVLSEVGPTKPRLRERLKQRVSINSERSRELFTVLGMVVAVLIILGVGYLIFHVVYDHFHSSGANYGSTGSKQANLNVQNKPNAPPVNMPSFNTLLPKGKTIADYSGWHSSSVAGIGSMYDFRDSLDGKTLVVAQQGLPTRFQSNPQARALAVAKHFSADRTVTAGDLTPVYLSDVTNNFQSAVFVKDNVLVLMGAGGQIPDSTWLAYVNSLQPHK